MRKRIAKTGRHQAPVSIEVRKVLTWQDRPGESTSRVLLPKVIVGEKGRPTAHFDLGGLYGPGRLDRFSGTGGTPMNYEEEEPKNPHGSGKDPHTYFSGTRLACYAFREDEWSSLSFGAFCKRRKCGHRVCAQFEAHHDEAPNNMCAAGVCLLMLSYKHRELHQQLGTQYDGK